MYFLPFMQRSAIWMAGFAVCMFAAGMTDTAFAQSKYKVPDKSYKKAAAQKKTSSKMESFLRTVENARSIKEVSAAFKKANFSESELRELEKQLKKKKLDRRLTTLKTTTMTKAKKSKARKINPDALLRKKKKAAKKKNKKFVAKQNKKVALSMKKGVKLSHSKRPPKIRGTVRAQRAPAAQMRLASNATTFNRGDRSRTMAMQGRPDLATLPLITREVEVPLGRRSVIHGKNFGRDPGRVLLKLDRPTWGTEEGVPLTVDDWTDNMIRISVPNDRSLVEAVGWESRPARVWVKVAGKDIYQARSFGMVYPDYELYRMRVDRIEPSTVSPGTTIFVRGRNMCLGRDRRWAANVRIKRGDKSIPTELKSFANDYVEVKVKGDISGVTAGQATVSVYTRLNDEIWAMDGWYRTSVEFQPAEDVKMIKNEGRIKCTPGGILSLFCLVGHARRDEYHDWDLRNGWKVDDAVLETGKRGFNGGANYKVRPERGSTRAKSRIEVWADAYSSGWYKEYFYIRGPRGVDYK
jgi:hypothetical protein